MTFFTIENIYGLAYTLRKKITEQIMLNKNSVNLTVFLCQFN